MSIGSERFSALPDKERAQLKNRIWRQISTHIDGMALGTTVRALHRKHILEAIALHPGITAGEIATQAACRCGYLHVMFKLLALQGWLTRTGPVGDEMGLRLSAEGAFLPSLAHFYERTQDSLKATDLLVRRHGTCQADDKLPLHKTLETAAEGWGLPLSGTDGEVLLVAKIRCHLDGWLAAGILARLSLAGYLPGPSNINISLPAADLVPEIHNYPTVRRFLHRVGWIDYCEGSWDWTVEGIMAALIQPQYWHALAYLPLLAHVDELLDLNTPHLLTCDTLAFERYMDRKLDISLSGKVFNQACRGPFFVALSPLFHRELKEQPMYLVDVGCGDGSLLAATWRMVVEQTPRGNWLSERPLIAVGIDLSRVAREATAHRLTSDRIPHLVLEGDIGDPAAIRSQLKTNGIDCDDCLFFAKSVLHDRSHRKPASPIPETEDDGGLVFVDDEGGLVNTAEVEQSLTELLLEWRPLIMRHGWIVIEAHTVPAEVGATNIGSTQVSILDATHGFSRQYLLDPQRFRRAAQRAGLRSDGGIEIGVAQMGHAVLTLDRFIAGASAD